MEERVGSNQTPKRRGWKVTGALCPHLPSSPAAFKYSAEATLESDTSTSLAFSTTLEEGRLSSIPKHQGPVQPQNLCVGS